MGKDLRVLKKLAAGRTPTALDPTRIDTDRDFDLTGVKDADFVALGLGATNMMAMLWSVAMGKRCVGVEMRGDPSLGVHWNIREDFYHHLCLIDQLIEERYGADRVPMCGDGVPFKLSTTWYDPDTPSGD